MTRDRLIKQRESWNAFSGESHLFLSIALVKKLGFIESGIYAKLQSLDNFYIELKQKRNELATYDGWFYTQKKDIQESLNIGRTAFDNAFDHLVNEGLVVTKKEGLPYKMYFFLDYDKALDLLKEDDETDVRTVHSRMYESCIQEQSKSTFQDSRNQHSGIAESCISLSIGKDSIGNIVSDCILSDACLTSNEVKLSNFNLSAREASENQNQNLLNTETQTVPPPPKAPSPHEMSPKEWQVWWNENCVSTGFHKLVSIQGTRWTQLRARVKEYGEDVVKQVLLLATQSAFLTGKTDRPFVASFDWLIRPNNFPKVAEGNYNNNNNTNNNFSNGTQQPNSQNQPRFNANAEFWGKMVDHLDSINGLSNDPNTDK